MMRRWLALVIVGLWSGCATDTGCEEQATPEPEPTPDLDSVCPDLWESVRERDSDSDGVTDCFDCGPLDITNRETRPCPDIWSKVDLADPGWVALDSVLWWSSLSGLSGVLSLPVEPTYWEFRYVDAETTKEPTVRSSSGSLCAAASSVPDCELQFGALVAEAGMDVGCYERNLCWAYFAVNHGDASYLVSNVDSLVTLLGDLSSLQEVALVIAMHGYHWGNLPESPPRGLRDGAVFAEPGGGWSVIARRQPADTSGRLQEDVHLLRLSPDGRRLLSLGRSLEGVWFFDF